MTDNVTTNHTTTTAVASIPSALLGRDSDWWNGALLVSLILAFIVAGIVAAATAGVIISQKREVSTAKADLDRYKVGVAGQVAAATTAGIRAGEAAGGAILAAGKANERAASLEKEAAEARLETEKLKSIVAWRTFSVAEASVLEKTLSAHPGSVNLRYMDGDPEALFLAIQVGNILGKANWKIAPGAVKPSNAIVFGFALPDASGSDAQNLRAAFNAARIGYSTNALPESGVSFSISTINGAPTLMIGSRMPVVP